MSHIDALRAIAMSEKRVLKDAFHWLNQLDLPDTWIRRQDCMRELSDALFEQNQSDRKAVDAVLEARGSSFREQRVANQEWLWQRIRRRIPPKEVIMPKLHVWFERWRHSKDNDGKPIFTEGRTKGWQNMLKIAEAGQLSDVPGVQLYFPRRTDKDGLKTYFCARGTNKNEAHHGQLHDHLATENNGVEVSHYKLKHFTFVTNYAAACAHIPGTLKLGHDSLHLADQQNELHEYIFGKPLYPDHQNVMLYNGTAGGTTGVVPVFETDISDSLVQGEVWKEYTGDRAFISKNSGSKIPALPVATDDERKLYAQMVNLFISEPSHKPDFSRFASEWDAKVNGKTIFRKQSSHLSEHYKVHIKAAHRKAEIHKERSEGRSQDDLQTLFEDAEPDPEPYQAPELRMADPDEAIEHIQPAQLGSLPSRRGLSTLDPLLLHEPSSRGTKRAGRHCSSCRKANMGDDEAINCPGRGGARLCPYYEARDPPKDKRRRQTSPVPGPPQHTARHPMHAPVLPRPRPPMQNPVGQQPPLMPVRHGLYYHVRQRPPMPRPPHPPHYGPHY